MKDLKNKKGFTMVELLVSMAIIGLLIATAIWGINLAQQSARNTQRRTAGSNIVAGFAEFYARFNVQPTFFEANIVPAATSTITLTNGLKKYVIGGFTGIMTPQEGTGITWLDNSNVAPNTLCDGSQNDTGRTRYIIGYSTTTGNSGMRVCVCLEGGAPGSANLSASSLLTCP
jgi:prepilin-type N-terminal cleavage/methylation domain-containing protein